MRHCERHSGGAACSLHPIRRLGCGSVCGDDASPGFPAPRRIRTQAEAQCAYLETCGLVDGVVTDDNDVFLFGGRHVYRHIFENKK